MKKEIEKEFLSILEKNIGIIVKITNFCFCNWANYISIFLF